MAPALGEDATLVLPDIYLETDPPRGRAFEGLANRYCWERKKGQIAGIAKNYSSFRPAG
ncbi:MAG: hypothetical protein Q8P84_02290 [Deltaproteobacteria bacterium]|nr:hypothetical protein [Deltaproteobacteria bacterium]MDZ4224870.1 hypothetical protein [bacterium]